VQEGELFGARRLPAGFVYEPEFVTREDETALIAVVQDLPLQEAQYKQYTAKRRVVAYGGRYDFGSNELMPAGPIPDFLHPLRERIAQWTGIAVTEWKPRPRRRIRPGTPLGWHRDVPQFEAIVGVSLAGACRMRLRPYPPRKGRDPDALAFTIEPRSVYSMRDDARWRWQHAISPTENLRYSITFRTMSATRRP
jgi:alkylated DNA repair dioxygenase AlkB